VSPLEDNFADVLGKALRGKKITEAEAARQTGLAPTAVRDLLAGRFDEATARTLATFLALDAGKLVDLGCDRYHPDIEQPPNLAIVTTPYHNMTVNAYILWDRDNLDAAIFDTGADAAPLLDLVANHELNVVAIFLTHSHADHIQALDTLQRTLDVEAWSSEFEAVPGTKTFRPGDLFNAGRHFIRTRHTPGHSPGGATFLIEGRDVQAAIVGDALFAGSIGGVHNGYADALDNIQREILSLADQTILCPGHGPLTTVAQEKAHNPFFA
jgi:hydroxyacylglutathione hydrolase